MRLRRPKVTDLEQIEVIAKTYQFPLVETFRTAAVTEDNGGVKSFSITRFILEGVIYLGGRKRDKAKSLDLIISQAISDAKELGEDQVYVFADDPKFASILEKRYKSVSY